MDRNAALAAEFEAVDEAIGELEAGLQSGESQALEPTLERTMGLMHRLLTAYGEHAGKPMPVSDDLLEVFKAFVKGDPSLNAVRDNLRELVYYRNCLDMDRRDALPAEPDKMAVRTARHVYLYLHSRCEQEDRLS
ncbi:MAG TPA: hypothetical protein VKA14_06000 [Gammaproteobacteria bacterium]|nr:hypothetical protein [Gammaproteobacteria bacterium]